MTPTAATIKGELAALQRGRGLQRTDLAEHIGPHLASALALDLSLPVDTVRVLLTEQLAGCVEGLAADLKLVFFAALRVNPSDPPTLRDRLVAVGTELDRLLRTVQRRVDDANLAVAEILAARAAPAPFQTPAWYIISLTTEVDLTEDRPWHRNEHVLRVVAPTLDRVTERVSFSGADDDADPTIEVSGAATVAQTTRPYPTSWAYELRLDRSYRAGEEVRYTTLIRSPSVRAEDSMSLFLPMRKTLHFSTTVHFGRPSVAAQAWRVDGVPLPVAEDERPCGPLFDLDAESSVHAAYNNLEIGSVYGLRWTWAEDFGGR